MTRIRIKCEKCLCTMGQLDDDANIDGKPIINTRVLCVNCAKEEKE